MTTTTASMNVAAPQICGGGARGRSGRRRRPAVLRLDLRWARLLRLAVATRVVRLVWDQLLACSSCGGGGGGQYRRLGPPQAGDVLTPVPVDDQGFPAPDADAVDAQDVVGLKVSLLGDCHTGKTSFMVSSFFLLISFLPYFCRPACLCNLQFISWFVIAVMFVARPCFSYSTLTNCLKLSRNEY
jgi:hypothetical protein